MLSLARTVVSTSGTKVEYDRIIEGIMSIALKTKSSLIGSLIFSFAFVFAAQTLTANEFKKLLPPSSEPCLSNSIPEIPNHDNYQPPIPIDVVSLGGITIFGGVKTDQLLLKVELSSTELSVL